MHTHYPVVYYVLTCNCWRQTRRLHNGDRNGPSRWLWPPCGSTSTQTGLKVMPLHGNKRWRPTSLLASLHLRMISNCVMALHHRGRNRHLV